MRFLGDSFFSLWFVSLMLFSIKSVAQIPAPQHPAVATEGEVLIFVSFSMPETSLKQWFEQAKKIHAPLVVRGLVNDSMQDTQARLLTFISNQQDQNAIEEEEGGITIDPRLFTEYAITQVPAVVVRDTTQACMDSDACSLTYPFDVVYGDVSLDYALKMLGDQVDGIAADVARDMLKRWQGTT